MLPYHKVANGYDNCCCNVSPPRAARTGEGAQ